MQKAWPVKKKRSGKKIAFAMILILSVAAFGYSQYSAITSISICYLSHKFTLLIISWIIDKWYIQTGTVQIISDRSADLYCITDIICVLVYEYILHTQYPLLGLQDKTDQVSHLLYFSRLRRL